MKNLIILTIVVLPLGAGLFTTCTRATTEERDIAVMVISTRLLQNAMQNWPDHFSPLLQTAQKACQISGDKQQAIEDAFATIARVISRDLEDQTLKDDLRLLIQILGIGCDATFNIVFVSPDARKYLEMFVCIFAQGANQGGDI